MQPIVRSKLIWLTLTTGAAGTTENFPDVPELNGAHIRILGYETFTNAQLVNTPDRTPVIAAAEAIGVVLTFNKGSDSRFMEMPWTSLDAQLNGGIWKEIEPTPFDFQKSEVLLTAAVTVVTQISLPVQMYYATLEDLRAMGYTNL